MDRRTLDLCAWCSGQYDQTGEPAPCLECEYPQLLKTNREAWEFFSEIAFWGGCGYDDNGIFIFGEFTNAFKDGLDIVLSFAPPVGSRADIEDLFDKLKIILATVRESNAPKYERLKRASKS
jgi:hypothetical protein